MKTVEPLRSMRDIQKLKSYFLKRKEYRNYLLVTIGLNTALRISDILNLRWADIWDYNNNKIKNHIRIVERKTKKEQRIFINDSIKQAVIMYRADIQGDDGYIFKGKTDKPIDRINVYRVLKRACRDTKIPDIACHSLRKTFGYQAWKNGTQPAVLMSVYNHSSYNVTRRYLGISQEDKDNVFKDIKL